MAAVVYLNVYSDETGTRTTFVCAKIEVAPLKRLTILRLELTAALLLSKRVNYVQQTLELPQVPVFLWTDLSVTLSWIHSHPLRWKDYVRNRVSSIQVLTPHCTWKLVPANKIQLIVLRVGHRFPNSQSINCGGQGHHGCSNLQRFGPLKLSPKIDMRKMNNARVQHSLWYRIKVIIIGKS